MQPPTEPTSAGAQQRHAARGDEGELYRRHHRGLHRAVAHAVNAPRELIEDACQNAWAIMLRAQPDRTSIFGWLYVVATREAFRLCEGDRRHLHLEAMVADGSWDPVIADAVSIDDILEAREALEILANLPERQRADLTLLVAGFSYVEIAEMTGGRTYTNVKVQLGLSESVRRGARTATRRHGASVTFQRFAGCRDGGTPQCWRRARAVPHQLCAGLRADSTARRRFSRRLLRK